MLPTGAPRSSPALQKRMAVTPSNWIGRCFTRKGAAVAIELDHDKVWNMQDKAEFYSEVLTVVVDGKEEKVKVQAVQRHAFKPKLTHIDFVRA